MTTSYYSNHAPVWARGTFIWRLNLPDATDALERAAKSIAQIQSLLDGTVRSVVFTSGAIGIDHGFQNWDGPWPYFNRPSYRVNHDWNKLARFMVEIRDGHNAWISFATNLTDVNVGLSTYPETRAFFERLREANAIYTRDGGECGVPAKGPAYVPQRIPVETAKMPYVKVGDPGDIFAIVDYRNFWKSGLAREMIDEFFSHLPYAPPVLYLDVLSTTGNNLCVGVPDGLLGGSQKTQEEGRRLILDYIKSKGSEPGGEGPMACTRYNWNHGGMSANDYSQIQTGWAQGCCSWRGAEWQHVYGNIGAYSLDMDEKLIASAAQYVPVAGGGTMMTGVGTAAPTAAPSETAEWRTVEQVVEGFYLTAIQELYHVGLGNVRLPGGSGFDRLDEHRGRVLPDRFDFYTASHQWVAGAQADEGELTAPCSVAPAPSASNGKVVAGLDGGIASCCRVTLQVPAEAAGPATLLVHYVSPLGGTAGVEINGEFLGELDFPATSRMDIFGDIAIQVRLQAGLNTVVLRKGSIHAAWSDGTQTRWDRDGFRAWNGEVTFGVGYDRMWPDTWSGAKKIHFYSRDGGERSWCLPESWRPLREVQLFTLTGEGRSKPIVLPVNKGQVRVPLQPRQPAILEPGR